MSRNANDTSLRQRRTFSWIDRSSSPGNCPPRPSTAWSRAANCVASRRVSTVATASALQRGSCALTGTRSRAVSSRCGHHRSVRAHDEPSRLHFASTGRALAENSVSSRARGGRARRTFDERELGDWIDHLCRRDGEAGLMLARQQAEHSASSLGVPENRLPHTRTLAGVAVGSRQAETSSSALTSRRAGEPVDQACIARFEHLVEALRASAPQNHPVRRDREDTFLPFPRGVLLQLHRGH